MENLIYKEEAYKIIGICMEIHGILGKGLLEVVYKDAMEYEFKCQKIPYEREKPYTIKYKDYILPHKYNADFVVFNEIILEVKASNAAIEDHIKQTLNYLAIAKSPLSLIINFGENSLRYKRLVL